MIRSPLGRAGRVALAGLLAATAVPATMGITSLPARAAGCNSPWMDTSKTPDERTQLLLAAMTNTQKAKLTQFQDVIFAHGGAAGFIGGDASLCIPDLVLNDAGQGVGDAMLATTAFPSPISQAASWDTAMQQTVGAALGNQAWNRGVNVQLAPAIETNRVPVNGRNFEYFSEDPYLSGQVGAAASRGIQSQHVIATLKHYIANSQETDRNFNSSDVDERTLHEIYLPQYEAAIQQGGAGSVMCSYNRINSVHACENYDTLTTYLKQQIGFQGFVMSDWGAMYSTAASANNGNDMEMNAVSPTYFGSTLVTAVQNNQVSQARLDDMARRILREMFAVGLFDHPPTPEPAAQASAVDTPAANALAGQIAAEGIVLLKNQDAILPLPAPAKRIAAIGGPAGLPGALYTYNGAGSSHIPEAGFKPNVVTPLTGMQTLGATKTDLVTYADGSGPGFADAIAAATAADVAVVFVYDASGEGQDRASMSLPPNGTNCVFLACIQGVGYNQDALVEAVANANPNTVVVLETGAPALMPWVDKVKGVVEAWYPGQDEGDAIASVLFGDVNPSGKLPQTFPKSAAQVPLLSNPGQYPGVTVAGDAVGKHSRYTEGLEVGYRWYDAQGIQPLFPFGHGLSYTTFNYSNLQVVPAPSASGLAQVAFDVTNSGSKAGAEVAQLYVGAPPDNYAGEPVKALRGYSRVVLAPGQTQHVTLPVNSRAVSYWDSGSHRWQVENGCHPVLVGSSSRDIRLQASGLNQGLQSCASAATASQSGSGLPNTAASGSPLTEIVVLAALGILGGVLRWRRRRQRGALATAQERR
jgi:beta-glucosidase